MTDEEKEFYCTKKNDIYVDYIKKLEKAEVLPGVRDFLITAREMGIPMALGSASKNAPMILEKLGITELFDIIVDGNSVSKAKPDPEVFTKAADMLGIDYSDCIVFEDSQAGIDAAISAGMGVIAVDKNHVLKNANKYIESLGDLI